ncbi:Uncharacterised protein [uncultured archaeon]|nr:Uncharacterised protein [uncultured archaeon]
MSKPKRVLKFFLKDKPNGWASNFTPSPITIDGVTYPCVEIYYQAQRAAHEGLRKWIASCPADKPYHAMKAGRALRPEKGEVVEDWDNKKLKVMHRGLFEKYMQNPEFKKKLLSTGDAEFMEMDSKNPFWGIGDGTGKNWMGKLTETVREEIRALEQKTQTKLPTEGKENDHN